jgi:hypothetical protein
MQDSIVPIEVSQEIGERASRQKILRVRSLEQVAIGEQLRRYRFEGLERTRFE